MVCLIKSHSYCTGQINVYGYRRYLAKKCTLGSQIFWHTLAGCENDYSFVKRVSIKHVLYFLQKNMPNIGKVSNLPSERLAPFNNNEQSLRRILRESV